MRGRESIRVAFRDDILCGYIFFSTWGEATRFIFDINRRERFDPRGRYARVEW